MIGYIKIDTVKGVHVRKARIRILDADDYSHVKFEIEVTGTVMECVMAGDIWQACEYTVFDKPENA